VPHRYDTGDHLGVLLGPVDVSNDVELDQLNVRDVDPGNDPERGAVRPERPPVNRP
jgi:hypothetical protein